MDSSLELVVGNTYCLRIHLNRDDLPKEHPFLWNRHMRYEGIDESWKYGKSYIFSDELDMYSVLDRKNQVDYDVVVGITCVSVSHMSNGRWYIHICNRMRDGKPTLEIVSGE